MGHAIRRIFRGLGAQPRGLFKPPRPEGAKFFVIFLRIPFLSFLRLLLSFLHFYICLPRAGGDLWKLSTSLDPRLRGEDRIGVGWPHEGEGLSPLSLRGCICQHEIPAFAGMTEEGGRKNKKLCVTLRPLWLNNKIKHNAH